MTEQLIEISEQRGVKFESNGDVILYQDGDFEYKKIGFEKSEWEIIINAYLSDKE